MKIVFVPMLPTLYGRRYQLCKHIARAGHEVHLIIWQMPYPINYRNLSESLKTSWKKGFYKKDGIYIHKVRRLPFFFPVINRLWFQKQLRVIYGEFGVGAVISQSFFNETEPPEGPPLFFDLNDNYESYAKIYGSLAYKLSYKLLGVRKTVQSQLSRAAAVFAVSDLLVDYAEKFNTEVYKIPNGIDITPKDIKKPQTLGYGPHSLVYVSTFGKWSCVLELITLVHQMSMSIPDIRLLLIGEGTQYKAAHKLINDLKAHNSIQLLGPIYNRKRLFKIIQNCKVCLSISEKNEFRDSASPVKIFEYSALGKTIVSTSLNEVISLALPNVITYDADKESINLELAILAAFKRQNDNSATQKKIISQYSWDKLSSQMLTIINGRRTQ